MSVQKTSRPILRRMFLELRPEWPYLAGALGTQVLTSATALTVPYICGKLVDASYGKESVVGDFVMNHPVASCGAAIGFFAFTQSAHLARATLTTVAGERFALRLRNMMLHGAALRETAFLGSGQLTAGDLQTRVVGDVAMVQKAATSSLKMIRSMLMLSAGVPYLIYISPSLSIGSILLLPPLALAARRFGMTMKTRQNQVQQSLSNASSVAGEFATHFRLIRQFGGEKAELERFNSHAKNATARAIETSTVGALFDFWVDGIGQIVVVSVVAAGLYQVKTGSLTPGALSQFVMLSLMVANHSWSISSSYTKLMRGAAAAERIFALSDISSANTSFATRGSHSVGRPALPEDSFVMFPKSRVSKLFNRFSGISKLGISEPALIREGGDLKEFVPIASAPHLQFRDVAFSYDHTSVLFNVNLCIDRSKIVAIVGSSGSGKSTLSALATRLYDPTSGQVLFEGRDVREIPDLRQRIAVVDQDHVLLQGSILDNIRYPNRDAPLSAVEEALRLSNAFDFVRQKGINLQVGAGILSGGQRQRIAIARAILKTLTVPECKLFFLDEGLSNLDKFTAQHLWGNICALAKDRDLTVVHVTHQAVDDLIDSVDKVVRLDRGRVSEERMGARR